MMTTSTIVLLLVVIAVFVTCEWLLRRIPHAGKRNLSAQSGPWVVQHFGDGGVSYQSFAGPMLDPRDAHFKSREVAEEVARMSGSLARNLGLRARALPLEQAIREFERSG